MLQENTHVSRVHHSLGGPVKVNASSSAGPLGDALEAGCGDPAAA